MSHTSMVQRAAAFVGAVFLVVGVAGFIPVNTADDWLHFGLGVGMVVLGLALGRDVSERRTVAPSR